MQFITSENRENKQYMLIYQLKYLASAKKFKYLGISVKCMHTSYMVGPYICSVCYRIGQFAVCLRHMEGFVCPFQKLPSIYGRALAKHRELLLPLTSTDTLSTDSVGWSHKTYKPQICNYWCAHAPIQRRCANLAKLQANYLKDALKGIN